MTLIIKSSASADRFTNKFKQREEEKTIEQALIFLKLKDSNCPTRPALVFSRKQSSFDFRKQKNIDSTLHKDGPTNFRVLKTLKPDGLIVNGWLRGQGHKYQNATSFDHFVRSCSSSLLESINQVNKTQREKQDEMRKKRTQSAFVFNFADPKRSMEKIASLRQKIMKERENNTFVFKFRGIQFPQMTKVYTQQIAKLDPKGLVVKSGAFQNCANDQSVEFVVADDKSISKSGKSLGNHFESTTIKKRNEILSFKKMVEQVKLNQNDQNNRNDHQYSPRRRISRNINTAQPISRQKKSLKFVRSKSAKRETQLKQFSRKVSEVIKKQYYGPNLVQEVQLLGNQRPEIQN